MVYYWPEIIRICIGFVHIESSRDVQLVRRERLKELLKIGLVIVDPYAGNIFA